MAAQAKNQQVEKQGRASKVPFENRVLRLLEILYIKFLMANRREEAEPWATIILRLAASPQEDLSKRGTITSLIWATEE